VIELRNVGYIYANRSPWAHRALEDVSLTVPTGQRLVVVGANGSGKSTLAWLLAGVLDPTEGTVLLDGHPIDLKRGETAISFQHARLQLFRPTVAADIRFGTEITSRVVDDALALVGLDPDRFRDRRVDELSGGEQRRVALAGALVRRPRVLILDEPLAGLDAPGRRTLVGVIARVQSLGAVTVVSVTHDLSFAADLGERAIVLERGRIVADGPVHATVRADDPDSPDVGDVDDVDDAPSAQAN
jgi:energy-coupling factor transporter ATP-binding protein EcfA2